MFVIGIDGGGTKTIGIIVNQDGYIFAQVTVGPTNPTSVGMEKAKERLNALITSLQRQHQQAFSKTEAVFAGLAGTGEASLKAELTAFVRQVFPSHIHVEVDNDAIIALYSGTFGQAGVVQIAGTGSITYGENQDGLRDRVGGWGYLLGDEGSGYAIGRAGVHSALQAFDGVGESTKLTSLLSTHFNTADPKSFIPTIYGTTPRQTIASLSRYVIQAADAHDEVALRIIETESNKLGIRIYTLIKRLNFKEVEFVPIVLTGGIMNRADLFTPHISSTLNALSPPPFNFVQPSLPPVAGAAIAALSRLLRYNIPQETFIYHFNETV